MAVTGKQKYLWISNILPESIVEKLQLSVAGKKMEISIAQQLCKLVDCDILSTSLVGYDMGKQQGMCLWEGKIYKQVQYNACGILKSNKEIERQIDAFLDDWSKANLLAEKIVVIVNAPLAVCRPLLRMKKRYSLKIFSIMVDVPLFEKKKGIRNHLLYTYNVYRRQQGEQCLKKFDGLITFTSDALKELRLKIPYCEFSIGCEKNTLPPKNFKPCIVPSETIKVAYTGTFIEYNGTKELLEAFSKLDSKIELHLYGYGPLQSLVEQYSTQYNNIIFHGRVTPNEIMKELQQYDLLVNPRILDPRIANFTFPSKLIDYILSGRNVLSSNFKTLPRDYKNFLIIIDEVTPQKIKEGVRSFAEMTIEEKKNRVQEGINYIKEHQTYDVIVGDILKFVNNNQNI